MAWIYEQLTGRFTDPLGVLQGKGYSGQPPHSNKPEDEGLVGLGPIPKGDWMATGVEMTTTSHGPFVIVLSPDPTTRIKVNALGRDSNSFRIHGERLAPPPGYASDGCIILSRDVRELFWRSLDHDVQVITGGLNEYVDERGS